MSKSPTIAYSEIFKKDPLLTSQVYREEYGRLVLEYILDYRSQKILAPTHINLFDGGSCGAIERQLPVAPETPLPAELLKDYKKSIYARDDSCKASSATLFEYTTMCDGNLTRRRRPLSDADEKLLLSPNGDDKPPRPLPTISNGDVVKPGHLRLAAVGHRVTISAFAEPAADEQLCFVERQSGGQIHTDRLPTYKEAEGISRIGRTVVSDLSRQGPWLDVVRSHVATALDRGAHIVALPEFSLPPDSSADQAEVESSLVKVCEEHIGKTPDTSGFFVFSGSRHDGAFNRGLIVSGQNRDGKCELSVPRWHYKLSSARSLGENVLGPGTKFLNIYELTLKMMSNGAPYEERFHVYIPICYDVFDISVFLALVKESQKSPEMFTAIILVPSFNPSKEFVTLLRDLSFLGRCVVAYINSLSGNSELFICGMSLVDLQSDGALEKMMEGIESLQREISQKTINESWAKRRDLRSDLDSFGRVLESYDFSNMVRVEHCEQCHGKRNPGVPHACNGDILYYDIDMGFLRSIANYRGRYFDEEVFLAKPLRAEPLLPGTQSSDTVAISRD